MTRFITDGRHRIDGNAIEIANRRSCQGLGQTARRGGPAFGPPYCDHADRFGLWLHHVWIHCRLHRPQEDLYSVLRRFGCISADLRDDPATGHPDGVRHRGLPTSGPGFTVGLHRPLQNSSLPRSAPLRRASSTTAVAPLRQWRQPWSDTSPPITALALAWSQPQDSSHWRRSLCCCSCRKHAALSSPEDCHAHHPGHTRRRAGRRKDSAVHPPSGAGRFGNPRRANTHRTGDGD